MTLLIPNFYGGSSGKYFVQDEKSASYKALSGSIDNQQANQLANYSSAYWGPQSFAGGAYYGGAIVFFLFVIGILFAEKRYVWWLVPLSALSLMLSWGDSFASFNYFLFDYLPGYNKFRSVNFALVIFLFAMPLLGMLGLEQLFQKGINKETKRKLWIAFSVAGGVCLLVFLFAGMSSFSKPEEIELPAWFLKALREDRKGLLRSDAFRSLAFISSVFILLFFDVRKRISEFGFFAFLIFMVAIDLSVVDKRYFSKENYHGKRDNSFFAITAADEEILKDKSYYRVYNLQNPWAEARTSYYHNSLGGYHGAKLRRYQDLYDSCLSGETQELISDVQAGNLNFAKYGVLNMLNAKYVVYGSERNNIIPNEGANGSAWFVREVASVNSPTEELKKVGEVNTRNVGVVDVSKFKIQNVDFDSLSQIKLLVFKPSYIKYESESAVNGLAVFSEIYYPKGWHAFIDTKEVTILRADYVLRALEIPSGKHTIEFRFEPKPYLVGNKITMASSWVLLLVVVGCLGFSLKKGNS